jgi:hypothetical protein
VLLLLEKRLDGRSLSEAGCSRFGTIARRGSLASLLSPGIVVALADRMCARALVAPRETLRRIRSFDKTRSKVFSRSRRVDVGFFAGAPGLGLGWLAGLDCVGLGGGFITGPPSLRLMESQISGKRAEKLGPVSKNSVPSAA